MEESTRRLVERANAGDREAFREIYEGFARRIFNFILRMVSSREEAEDIGHDTFVIAFRQISRLRDPEQLESWLYRIARNEVYQKFRRKKVEVEPLEPPDDPLKYHQVPEERVEMNPEQWLLDKELGTRIQTILQGLPYKLREVFVLATLQGLTYKEISGIVGRSVPAIKTDVYRARLRLRDALKKYFEGR